MEREDVELAIEDLLVLITMVPVLCLFALSFLFDNFGRAWTCYQLPRVKKKWPVFRDTAALAATALTFVAMEDGGSYGRLSIRGLLLWMTVCFATICVPTALDLLIENIFAANSRRNATPEVKSKAQRVILFGLRYGFVGYCCLFRASFFDAIILLRFAKSLALQRMPAALTLEDTECFLCKVSGQRRLWSSIVAVRLAMLAAYINAAGMGDLCIDTTPLGFGGIVCFASAHTHGLNILCDLLTMVCTNLFFALLLHLGTSVGQYLWKNKDIECAPGMGSFAVVLWMASIGFILNA
mmetsp:Transcript_26378/g.53570  ORF Transcript_26378/g.53570 Transcript_26378/m.53570 type:complete len:296 (-) Transcript_26378:127-1014(-)